MKNLQWFASLHQYVNCDWHVLYATQEAKLAVHVEREPLGIWYLTLWGWQKRTELCAPMIHRDNWREEYRQPAGSLFKAIHLSI